MAKFEQQQRLTGIANPMAGKAQELSTLADTLQGFGNIGMGLHRQKRLTETAQEAGAVDTSAGLPGLRSEMTETGQLYNKIVKQGFAADIRNTYTRRMNELSMEHPNDVVAFESAAKAYSAELLNQAPAEMRNFMRIDIGAAAEKYASQIRARQAEDNIKAGIMAADQALSGLYDDSMDDVRNGRDEVFVNRRQAYVDSVMGMGQLSESQKFERIQRFDKSADMYYHIGEVERMLDGGDYDGALKYKRRLERGEFKTFGEATADRDQVMAAIDKKVAGYFQDQREIEQADNMLMNDRYRENTDKLAIGLVSGDVSDVQLIDAFEKGDIGFNQYTSLKTFSKAKAATVTAPDFKWQFTLNAGDMDEAELTSWLMTEVARGRVNRDEAAGHLSEIRSGKFSPLGTDTSKREINWLRTSLQMDNSMVDITNESAVLRATAISQAQDAILEGVDAREAVQSALAWYLKTDAYSFVTLNNRTISTQADLEEAKKALMGSRGTMSQQEFKRHADRLYQIQLNLDSRAQLEAQQ